MVGNAAWPTCARETHIRSMISIAFSCTSISSVFVRASSRSTAPISTARFQTASDTTESLPIASAIRSSRVLSDETGSIRENRSTQLSTCTGRVTLSSSPPAEGGGGGGASAVEPAGSAADRPSEPPATSIATSSAAAPAAAPPAAPPCAGEVATTSSVSAAFVATLPSESASRATMASKSRVSLQI